MESCKNKEMTFSSKEMEPRSRKKELDTDS